MSDVMEGYKQTEVGVIPGDWEVKRLGDIASIRRGASPRPIKDPKWFADNGRGWIRISDVTNSKTYLNETTQYLSEAGARNSVSVDKGDLVMSICATIGMPIIINIPACIHDGFVLFKNYENELDTFFLYYFLESKTELLSGKGQPGTQKNLNISIVSDIQITLPPTRIEQTAIATTLKDANALLAQLEKLIAKKRNIKQGAMQELLKPKEGWKVKKLGEIFKFLNTANNSRADLAESGEVEYIHYGDIHTRWNCFLDCSKNELPFIDKAKINSVPFLENGDLVIADASEDYEGLGTCVEIKNIGKRKIVAGLHTLLLRANKNIIADGFKGYLRNYHGLKDTLIRLSTGVSVFGISKTNLKEVEVSIPPTVEEQNRIIQILSDMDAEIESMEKNLEKYKMIKQGMMQNLLTGKIRLI